MRNIWAIYKNDMKNIFTNWVSAVLIIGLIVLPSLYAWFNIAASWNPYGNTGNMPIGIVNNDNGGTINHEKINVGDLLVKKLHTNKQLDWQFLDEEKALSEVKKGKLFAVIVVPNDFTKTLATVLDKNPQKAKMSYYVNEKINSIAPKITGEGASTVVTGMSEKFVGEVDKTIFEAFNKVGVELQKELPDIEKFEKFIFNLEKNLPSIHTELTGVQKTAKEADSMLTKAQSMMPQAVEITNNGLKTVTTALAYVDEGQRAITAIDQAIKKDVATMKQTSKEIDRTINEISNISLDTNAIEKTKATLANQISTNQKELTSLEESLLSIKAFNKQQKFTGTNDALNSIIIETRAINKSLAATKQSLNTIDDSIQKAQAVGEASMTEIKTLAKKTSMSINGFIDNYENKFSTSISKELSNAKKTLTQAQSTLTEVQQAIPEATQIVKETSGYVTVANGDLKKAMAAFPIVSSKVKDLATKLRKANSEMDLNTLIGLLTHNAESEKSFFEEPIQLKQHAIFPIKNYGTGMTPFYGILSLWVGGLLLASLLEVNVNRPKKKYTIKQIYFGKLFTFWTFGLCQALIMSLGCMLILGVKPESPVLFILFCMFASLVFITIVYTLTSVFGDVGKALSIVILVLQIAGAGGTYPVVLLPKFFQVINPFLPFTYAIELAREAVGGVLWANVLKDFLVLGLIMLVFILLGSFYKKVLNRETTKLMEKSRESGLFH
ncbi:YhgE/Pip domain-containing protein [Kurthia sibirica]|uniref:YhgE/Pip domain-containing protein n=1 Tax=Kurthia sibirica TaxID=202750 RepID=A0A2U3AN10_9BACL|nr:YhgE/Pip domain-containing protein [Kurthia sibirica]PWI25879.1 YhgE/Pip domain-containing protein [Kurthia sibirica]GEK34319.1 phage infection protein [Kurthia sibirica]